MVAFGTDAGVELVEDAEGVAGVPDLGDPIFLDAIHGYSGELDWFPGRWQAQVGACGRASGLPADGDDVVLGDGRVLADLQVDVSFFEKLHGVIQQEPDEFLGPEAKGMMAAVGIVKGKPFAPDERMKKIFTDAATIGNAAARAISYSPRIAGQFVYEGNKTWLRAYANKDTTFTHNGARDLEGRIFMQFGYICVSPAMAVTVAGIGSDYIIASTDSSGDALDGSKTYKLHLPANVPATDFWAVTMYDTQTRSQLQTDQQFPTLGSQDEGLAQNDDGSIDIYFSANAPAGQEHNWLQTIPGKSWFIVFRMYGPEQAWIDRPGAQATSNSSTDRPTEIGAPRRPGPVATPRSGQLRDLEEMTVQVTEEGPDLTTAIDRCGQELGSSFAEELEGPLTIIHPKDDLTADPIGVVRHCQRYGRLVRGWLATSDEQ